MQVIIMSNLKVTRRTVLAGAGAAAMVGFASTASRGDSATSGAWSAPIDIGGEAIHAALLRTGEVVFFSGIEGNPSIDHTSYAGIFDPASRVSRPVPLDYDRDIFCSGMNLLPDGHLFLSGGHDPRTGKRADPNGVFETELFDPGDRSWSSGPLMAESRWYPTNVAMPSGRSLVFGGSESNTTSAVKVESYDHGTGAITSLPTSADNALGWYPRMHLMPNGRVVKTGPARRTQFFDPDANRWIAGPSMIAGNRPAGSSVLLAGASTVLTFGGRASNTSPPRATAELLDLTASSPRWRSTGSLRFPRIHANAVVLPDGKVLALGGGTSGTTTGPQRAAEMYDPATGRWTVMAAAVASRMYHSTALLLPDGRVFTGGQKGVHAKTVELYSPPYLFRGPRPTITSAGATVARGGTIPIASPQAADITRIALIRASSVTHQVNTDQRHLPLAFTTSAGHLSARLPANTNLTPPGYYMLFVLNADGVPSVAKWVRVT
jgi:hypothetical protein